MQDFSTILHNTILWVSLFACILAQILKLAIEIIRHGKANFRTLVETGGMPSAHSAFVGALATGVGQATGWDSPEFAIAVIFAVIVMYDAAGVRQAAGKQARILNQIVDDLFRKNPEFNEDRLKELLGHTRFQVIAGCALGVAVSWVATRVVYG